MQAMLARLLVEIPVSMKHRTMCTALASHKNTHPGEMFVKKIIVVWLIACYKSTAICNYGVASEILEKYLKACEGKNAPEQSLAKVRLWRFQTFM